MDQRKISYGALRAILSGGQIDLRERLHDVFPSIRAANRKIPYHMNAVTICDMILEIDGRAWNLSLVWDNQENQDNSKTDVNFTCEGYRFSRRFSRRKEELFEQLLKEYFRDLTYIKKLVIWSLPAQFPKNVRLYVESFHLEHPESSVFREVKQILVDNLQLKKMRFVVRDSTLDMFEDELVKNATRLSLQFPYHQPVDVRDELFFSLKNEQIYMIHVQFPVEKIHALAMNWVATARKIGTKFFLSIEDFTSVLDVIDHVKPLVESSFDSKIVALGDSYFAFALTIPIDENSELVLHGGEKLEVWKPFEWTFRMEVMEKGATVKT